jgi:next-to-BRCA1 protein 1
MAMWRRLNDVSQCMHPTCPDFDLCSNCEAHPIPMHPLTHPLLKMKTANTVIPTVYRVGSTVMIPTPTERAVPTSKTTPVAEPETMTTDNIAVAPLVDVSVVSDIRHQLSHLLAPAPEDAPLIDTSVTEVPATPSTLSKESLLASPVQAPANTACTQGSTRQQLFDILSRYEADQVEQASAPMTMPGGMPEEVSPVLRVRNLPQEEQAPAPEMTTRVGTPRVSLPITTFVPVVAEPTPKALEAEVPTIATPHPKEGAAEGPLRAAFVADLNIPDGQVFPPGAEFVKSWVLSNDGARDWPESTELRYVAGDRMGDEGKIVIGAVSAGTKATVSTPELKVGCECTLPLSQSLTQCLHRLLKPPAGTSHTGACSIARAAALARACGSTSPSRSRRRSRRTRARSRRRWS